MRPLLLGTIFGTLIAFVWHLVAWELIPWHEKTMLSFDRQDEVVAAIAAHVPRDGTYLLAKPGAWMLAGIRRDSPSFGTLMINQVLYLMAASFLLTWMVLQTSGLNYGRKVAFAAVAGLAAGVMIDLPNWNWFGFSGGYTAVNLIDSTITWALAGLAIARVAH